MTTSEPTTDIVPVRMGRFVPPWVSDLPIETTVTDDYTIEIGITEHPLTDESITPGTDVKVIHHDNQVAVKPMEAVEREKAEKQQRRKLAKKSRERARKREERKQKEERSEFWSQYDIPIDFATSVNIRIGELRRGSTGTGRTKNTVDHFIVLEDFTDGRVSRGKYDFLCGNRGKRGHYGLEELEPESADEETTIVTCQTCLERMKRWKQDE